MKRFFSILILGGLLSSCSDSLDRLPHDQLTPETAYETVDDLEFAISGIYNSLDYFNIVRFNSITMDNCKIGKDTGGQDSNLYNIQITPGTAIVQTIYQGQYYTASLASRLIQNAERITPGEGQQNQYNYILAQAYAMRALAHYNLFVHFTPDMLDPNGSSIPYVDYVVTTDWPVKNSVQEVKAGMLADLDMAESLIGTNGDVFVVNPDFITFLRARIQLVTGSYQEAIDLSNELIAIYPLADRTQYVNMFLDADVTEVIFKQDFTQADTRFANIWYFTATEDSPFMEMSTELYNELDPADVRYEVLVEPDSDPANGVHMINKYPGSNGIVYVNDFKAMRVSELYLIKAEAQARMGQFGPAANTLKELRDARFGASTSLDSYANEFEALTAVLAERRIELAYEGQRYIDLRRFRNDLNQGMDRASVDCGGAAPCSLAPSDRRFTMPFPLHEMESNPNFTNNNPGY